MNLRAVVIGAGWAGEGHTEALRQSGVDVIALCGRTPEPAQAMAEKLGIGDVRFDWKEALEELRPDIVSLATPASPHQEMAEVAAGLGCHLFCDKPLSPTTDASRVMLQVAEGAGVKHAYGTSSRYTPAMRHAKALLTDDLIGQIREIESTMHGIYPHPNTPFGWVHRLDLGGGALYNGFTHVLGHVLFLTGGKVTSAIGEARYLYGKAPVGDIVHDSRAFFSPMDNVDESAERREVDADSGYSIVAQIQTGDGEVSALFQTSFVAQRPDPAYLALHGEKGSLVIIGGVMTSEIKYCRNDSSGWESIDIPENLVNSFPEDFVQGCWNELFREFIAAINGQGDVIYPTFYDGWIASEIIDIARHRKGWQAISEPI